MAENDAPTNEQQAEPQAEPQAPDTDWEAKYKEAVAQSRKWEDRAKANKDKADKWDAYEQEGMSEAEKVAQRAERAEAELAQLKADAQRRTDAHEVAKATGAPEALLLHCADRADMEAFAQEYGALERTPAAPPAPSSRVIRGDGSKQNTRDKFASYFD